MALTRGQYIEQIRRLIYGGFPPEDAEITIPLVNIWLNQAIAAAAKTNYTDSLKLEGVSYINNSFYTTFKNLTVTKDSNSLYKVELPEVPVGIGQSEGVSTIKFKNSNNQISYPIIWLSMNQLASQRGMRDIPNKLLGYVEGSYVYIMTTIPLSNYSAIVTMISGGSSNDLKSTLNVPSDYLPQVTEYIKQQLMFERNIPVDITNDGIDAIQTSL